MPDQQSGNPYVAPTLVNELSPPAAGHSTGETEVADTFAKNNIVGLILTMLGSIALELSRKEFSKLFANFKLEIPFLTRLLMTNWFVYGVILLFVALFMIGIISRPRKRSALIGTLGLIGLFLATVFVVIGLFLPFITLVDHLT
ncbi:MAG: hypothetical protein K8T91_08965 [Planctomycetes bacterium]|nr:hypothetical protein [Planctomycetota bacterium]